MARETGVSKKSYRRQRRRAGACHNIGKQGAAVLALGLGLAAAGPAEAYVIYQAIPPEQQTLMDSGLLIMTYNGTPQITDPRFAIGHNNQYNGYNFFVGIQGVNGGQVANDSGSYYAAFLTGGQSIGSSSYWYYQAALGYRNPDPEEGFTVGNFPGQGPGYLGLQFQDDEGDTHYGWAKVVVPADVTYAKIFGFAFETEADTEILAGAGDPVPLPGSLALLASGAAGLLAYRRMRRGG